ncbi:hypothetical protein HK096_000970, partial [Nowakowskiella sp. JEL0078]
MDNFYSNTTLSFLSGFHDPQETIFKPMQQRLLPFTSEKPTKVHPFQGNQLNNCDISHESGLPFISQNLIQKSSMKIRTLTSAERIFNQNFSTKSETRIVKLTAVWVGNLPIGAQE